MFKYLLKLLLIFVLFYLGILIGTQISDCPVREWVHIKTVENKPDHLFEQIIQDVYTNYTYVRGEFMCGNFSRETIRRLEQVGYETEYIKGEYCVEECGCHAWIKMTLYIDPTNNMIMTPDYYKENYIENNCL